MARCVALRPASIRIHVPSSSMTATAAPARPTSGFGVPEPKISRSTIGRPVQNPRNVSSMRSASSWSWIVFEPVAGLPDSTRATWRRS